MFSALSTLHSANLKNALLDPNIYIAITNKVYQFNGEDFSGNIHYDAFGGTFTAIDRGNTISNVDKKDGTRSYYFSGEQKISTNTSYPSVTLPFVSTLTNNGISICFWCKKTGDTVGAYHFVRLGANVSGGCILWGAAGNSLLLRFLGVTDQEFYLPSKNNWHHIAITITSDNIVNIYMNGNQEKTNLAGSTIVYTEAKKSGFFGCAPTDGSYAFRGYVDNFCMFNKILTQAEVTAIYNGKTIV